MKSGNLNFLEPSGPLQACNGTALPLPLPLLERGLGGSSMPRPRALYPRGHPVKVSVKFTLEKATKAQNGNRGIPLFLYFNLSARWGGSSTPSPGRFNPLKRPGTHCTQSWVGPRADMDESGKFRPPPEFYPRTVQARSE